MPRFVVFLILALPLVGAYALYATGIVAIYQASRVLNLAHGAMAAVPAFLTYSMVEAGLPIAIAFPAGVASGALLGLAIERVFVRRLRGASPTAQTVGTVAAFGLLVSLSAKIWGTTGLTAPGVFPEGEIAVGSSIVRYGQLGLFVVALVLTGALYVFLRSTWFGLAMRAAAVNRRAAALMGANPDMTTAVAWALGGAMAGVAGILLAAVTVLQPYTLSLSVLPAFVAALIGGLESLPGALVGSLVVGLVLGFVPLLADLPVIDVVLGQVGGPELALALTAMIVMAIRGKRFIASDVRGDLAGPAQAAPRTRSRRVPAWLVLLLIGWVWIPNVPFTLIGDANQALIYTMIGVSLVLLTGWVGQISLAQGAFVGIGAFGSILVSNRLGLQFPFTIPVAAAMSAGAAALLGMVALRVRGLYLAVATLIFGWMADSYLFSSPWFVGSGGSATAETDPIGAAGGYPYLDFTTRPTFYLVALAGAALSIVAMANLRRSKTGRAFVAIRGSEMAAASLGIDVTRYKLLAFALAGAIAGVAGSLLALNQETVITTQFTLSVSLFFLSIAVVGGLQSTGGAVASAILFALLNEVFFRVEALHGWLDVVSAALLVAVLLFYPGGLAAVPAMARRLAAGEHLAAFRVRVQGWRAWTRGALRDIGGMVREIGGAWHNALNAWERRAGRLAWVPATLRSEVGGLRSEGRSIGRAARAVAARVGAFNQRPLLPSRGASGDEPAVPDTLDRLGSGDRVRVQSGRVVLGVDDVTVRFGGLVAVGGVSLDVREGEIAGLIGPNGAGKTTLFNAIAGFVVPTSGTIHLDGEDVTALGVHERAARGIGRTFQTIQLAPDLTVRENLMVATHVRNPAGVLSDLLMSSVSVAEERRAAERVQRVIDVMDLGAIADLRAADQPFGSLRLVEIARALVTGAPLLMLDEPASGLDESETMRFRRLLERIRDSLGVSMLLIEHDVQLVMALCDRVSVLDRGELIAQGPRAQVRTDPAVVRAYLGREPASV